VELPEISVTRRDDTAYIKSVGELRLAQSPSTKANIEVLTSLGSELEPHETLVICNWTRNKRISPGAISYYAAVNGLPFVSSRSVDRLKREIDHGSLQGALRGACRAEQLDEIAEALPGLIAESRHGEFVFWTAHLQD
jgi:hypothetical protein